MISSSDSPGEPEAGALTWARALVTNAAFSAMSNRARLVALTTVADLILKSEATRISWILIAVPLSVVVPVRRLGSRPTIVCRVNVSAHICHRQLEKYIRSQIISRPLILAAIMSPCIIRPHTTMYVLVGVDFGPRGTF